ncbi:VOC family protein [Paucibacter sp. B2R-40]|uniref:VOC family protein n=1 Tax=Paucibacter sp. B2R-40 TaxID=2893554 RepID=UPI0021E4DDD6|nr:VOC family protein [Paucibacter sp. B2R-40]MCV2356402.1 VOC family protein [Paucibacter sp. B2R-40]
MLVQGIHHVAYRCRDVQETIKFYKDALDMDLILAISEDHVPSTKEPNPYMHIFLDAGRGNVLAFFELPDSPAQGRDENTPAWVQHLAFQVEDVATLERSKAKLQAMGIEVLGPTNHEIFQSIYLHDPNGHRIELAANTVKPGQLERLRELAPTMIEEWGRTHRAVKHAAWLHEKEFAQAAE